MISDAIMAIEYVKNGGGGKKNSKSKKDINANQDYRGAIQYDKNGNPRRNGNTGDYIRRPY